jgi:transcriptional regulator with XRE-family HTH domain
MGRIYFTADRVKFDQGEGFFGYYKIMPMTILINRELCKTPEMINSVIIHECCHLFLDMPFFSLQMLADKPFQTHVSKKHETESRIFNTDNPVERMEWQAEKLPAYVLMEETNTRKEIRKFMSEHGEDRSPEGMRRLVEKLAEVFQVPPDMAKGRVIELGYPEADGVETSVNGKPIPDHGCAGPWRPEITYTVSRTDAARMLIEDPAFSRAVHSGLYTYAEGHFCLDDEKYVYRDRNGEKRLSAYALRHMDECCLTFRKPGQSMKVTYLKGQAEKHTPAAGTLQTRHALESEPDSKERIRQNRQFCNDAMLWAEVKRTLPDGIKEAVFALMRRKRISQEEIGMRLGVSRTAFAKWFKKDISLRHVIAICIALDVRMDVGLEFVKLAGYTFMNTDEHALLSSFLFETEALNVARANEMLREKGMKPLTEGQSEELAEAS